MFPMKILKYILCLILLAFSYESIFCHSYKYELSICTIFRDDAKYLPEWIEFHRKQGVDHFFLYDNLSSDNPKEILKPYLKSGLVSLIGWPYESTDQEDWNHIQCSSYKHCVESNLKMCKWIAFLDTDEFLFCPDKKSIKSFLKKHDGYGSVSAFWMMYGTSNVNIPKDGNLLDYLVYRAQDDYSAHKTCKTIAQAKYIEDIINPHFVFHKKGKKNLQVGVENLRINHYWSRDLDFFYNVKIPRREKWYHDRELQIHWESEMNDVYDPILSNSSG